MNRIQSALDSRVRLRTIYSIGATLVFSTLLGLGAGMLMNEEYTPAIILLSLSAAAVALALTVCSRAFENWLERRHPLDFTP